MKTICPDEELLADYLEGRLSDNERSEIEKHLSDCERCLDEFMVARDLVRADDRFELDSVPSKVTQAAVRLVHSQASLSPDTLQERFKRLIKGLYSRTLDFFHLTPWGEWHLAPIRGSKRVVSKDLIHLKKTFKDMEAEIEIEKTGENKSLIRVRSPKDIEQWKSVRVTLIKGEREITSHLLNQGSVLFEDIPFGHYSLTFFRDGVKIGIYPFEIKETHYGGR